VGVLPRDQLVHLYHVEQLSKRHSESVIDLIFEVIGKGFKMVLDVLACVDELLLCVSYRVLIVLCS